MHASSRLLIASALLVSLASPLLGCATRTVRHSAIKTAHVEIDFVRKVSGFTTEERDFEHPAIISVERLQRILSALEIESRSEKGGTVRQPAFHPSVIPRTAEALARGFAEVGPNEEIGANIIRKEMRLGIFHQKYLTSFLAFMENGHLYIMLRRVDWLIPQAKEDERLPKPSRDKRVMNFRVISGDPIYFAGVQDLEIDWRNEQFKKAFQLPGTTKGQKRRREVLDQMPVPKDEFQTDPQDAVSIENLSPDQLRALADLEEQRREGGLTEAAYQRARRQLLRKR